jgi:hypothetical protein
MKIEMLSVSTLKPDARNARTHSKKQIKQIARSIERFGFCNPILIDDDKRRVPVSSMGEYAPRGSLILKLNSENRTTETTVGEKHYFECLEMT